MSETLKIHAGDVCELVDRYGRETPLSGRLVSVVSVRPVRLYEHECIVKSTDPVVVNYSNGTALDETKPCKATKLLKPVNTRNLRVVD